jgi:hypothetical protein
LCKGYSKCRWQGFKPSAEMAISSLKEAYNESRINAMQYYTDELGNVALFNV